MKEFLDLAIRVFEYYKSLGEGAMLQVEEAQLFLSEGGETNSIAVIVKHLHGNMRSRWTDIFTTDGEKPDRNREAEFELEGSVQSRESLMQLWEEGWQILLEALRSIEEKDHHRLLYIRNEGHTITEAVTRQIAHYAYHVGQIVHIAKGVSTGWQSLSIPKGASDAYNRKKFEAGKAESHYLADPSRIKHSE